MYQQAALSLFDCLPAKASGTVNGGASVSYTHLAVQQFDLHFKIVHIARAAHDELIMRPNVRHADEHALDLRGEDIDALDDEHVVAPAADLFHARMRPAAFARLVRDAGDICLLYTSPRADRKYAPR